MWGQFLKTQNVGTNMADLKNIKIQKVKKMNNKRSKTKCTSKFFIQASGGELCE